jgi:BMFP domain-containing protein YqiC
MQTEHPLFDQFARFATQAAGAAQGLRAEIESIVRARVERLAQDWDFVPREEFEVVKKMAAQARAENAILAERIAKLENASHRSAAET